MHRLRRCFSRKYPFHSATKQEAQTLTGFPLQFYSTEPQTAEKSENIRLSSQLVDGAAQAYLTLIECLAQKELTALEELMELNMHRKLTQYFRTFEEEGYTLKQCGSIDDAELELFAVSSYSGSITPYRNLNALFPQNRFKEYHFRGQKFGLYVIPDQAPKSVSFSDFAHLNLKELNQGTPSAEQQDELKSLMALFRRYPISIQQIDIGITTSAKLYIEDRAGNVIEGSSNPDTREFHCMRLERLVSTMNRIASFFFRKRDQKEFIEKQFESQADQFMIVDIDNFMHGNPLSDVS